MRIKEGFILKEIAGEYVAVPFGETYGSLGAMISLNETGAYLWQLLESEMDISELEEALVQKYGIEPELASSAVEAFTDSLKESNLLVS